MVKVNGILEKSEPFISIAVIHIAIWVQSTEKTNYPSSQEIFNLLMSIHKRPNL